MPPSRIALPPSLLAHASRSSVARPIVRRIALLQGPCHRNLSFTPPRGNPRVNVSASRASSVAGRRNIQIRWLSIAKEASGTEGESKKYQFEDIKQLISKPNGRVLIDTREPSELLATGRIPSAVNIPISSSPDAFFLSDGDFLDRFGFERPGKETEVVFYCKAGVRSRAAAALARQGGWKVTGEYGGSWMDWEGRGGEAEKV